MKITFITPPPNLSGGLRVVAIHANLLRERGHDVTVVAQRRKPPGWKTHLRALAQGERLPKPAATHFDDLGAIFTRADHFGPITDADVPDGDVVIATWWETAFMVADLSPTKGRKFYLVQGHEVFSRLLRHISAGSYRLPLRKIAISGWLRDTMASAYGDDQVALVPNGVDLGRFQAAERGRQSLPTVGLMYATEGFKGLDVTLDALAQVRRAFPSLRVIAFGTKSVQRDLPLPNGSDFFMRPPQDRIAEIYASCDVFVVGSRSEGFGLPILEAMACRCPVVATRTGCAPDVIRDGVNGYLADVDDAAALAEGLRRILDLPEPEWKRMSDAALAEARSHPWEKATTLLEHALFEGGGRQTPVEAR